MAQVGLLRVKTEKWGSEADLAAAVVAYLEALQWTIYQEVEGFSGIADIVGVQDDKIIVVETKKSLTFDVIAQAMRWKPYAHQVSVAVPKTKGVSGGRQLAFRVCAEHEIGVLEVTKWSGGETHINEERPAPTRKKIIPTGLKMKLREEHKTYAKAGSANGGHWTPFKSTCEALRREVESGRPGRTLIEVVKELDHHYASPSSARNHLGHWIEKGKVAGVRLEKKDGKTLIFPAEPVASTK